MRLLSLGALCVLFLSGCGTGQGTRERHAIHIGENALLICQGRPNVPIAVYKDYSHALARAVASSDEQAVQRLVADGKAIEVPARTLVHVTRESYNERRVRILRGALKDKTGWVPYEWLQPDVT